WRSPADAATATALHAAFDIAAVLDLLTQLEAALETGQPSVETISQLVDSARSLIQKIASVKQRASGLTGAPFNSPGFWDTFPIDVLNDLLAARLQADAPLLFAALVVTGIIRYDR